MSNILNSKKIKVNSSISVNKYRNTMCFYTFLSLRFIIYAPSFILGKLFLEKTPLNLGSYLKYLTISELFKRWSRTKILYPYNLF